MLLCRAMSPRRRKPGKPRNEPNARRATKGQHGGSEGSDARALTSGQAARYCLVSADTIANWITAGRLAAQRTAGGQYRIRVHDLRAFMQAHDMRTELLDEESGHCPACWDFWAARAAGRLLDGVCGTCTDCPVYRSGAARCREVRPLLPGGTLRALSCDACPYFAQYLSPALAASPDTLEDL
jgi:excisionase family DNA binding protein